MRTQLRKTWKSRAPRERAIITIMTVVLGTALYLWLVESGGRTRMRLHANVMTLRAQAAGLGQQAAELVRLRATPATPAAQTDLGAQVQAQVDAAGLSHALVKFDAPDANQVVVAFGPVEFATWLNWVASLNSQHVRLAACRIEALPAPGMVSVTATLLRAS
jgi:type II secretory pathway component PulM